MPPPHASPSLPSLGDELPPHRDPLAFAGPEGHAAGCATRPPRAAPARHRPRRPALQPAGSTRASSTAQLPRGGPLGLWRRCRPSGRRPQPQRPGRRPRPGAAPRGTCSLWGHGRPHPATYCCGAVVPHRSPTSRSDSSPSVSFAYKRSIAPPPPTPLARPCSPPSGGTPRQGPPTPTRSKPWPSGSRRSSWPRWRCRRPRRAPPRRRQRRQAPRGVPAPAH
jgi:hypothetical protein